MNAHTPGPWIIRDGDEWTHDVVTHHGGLPDGAPNAWNIASINGRRDEAKSNLALIAAAPDLLEALDRLTKWAEVMAEAQTCEHTGDHPIAIARAALIKALTGATK